MNMVGRLAFYEHEREWMSIHDLQTKVVIKNDTKPDPDDDLRRLMLGMLAMLKRRFPNDWRKMVQEINEAKAA